MITPGLLGQRILWPATTKTVRATNRAISRHAARGLVEPYFGALEMDESHGGSLSASQAGLSYLDHGTASVLGSQGEGAIQGLSRHYQVRSLHTHAFRYSLFNCTSW
jgi:hypothetical protein